MAGQFMGKELVGQSHPEAGGQRPESRWTDVARGPCWGQGYSVPSSVPQSVGSVTSAGDTKLRVQMDTPEGRGHPEGPGRLKMGPGEPHEV